MRVVGLLIGPDAIEQKNALVTACMKPGEGELFHPYHGLLVARCEVVRPKRRRQDLNSFEVEMVFHVTSFLEPGSSIPIPSAAAFVTEDLDAALQESATASAAAGEGYFDRVWNYLDLPRALGARVEDRIREGQQLISEIRRPLTKVGDFSRILISVMGNAAGLALNANRLKADFMRALTFGYFDDENRMRGPDARESFFFMLRSFDLLFTGRTSDPEAARAVPLLIATAGASALSTGFSFMTFTSAEDATAHKDAFLRRLDEVTPLLPDDIAITMQELRTTVEAVVRERAARMPRIVSYTPPATISAVELSYLLYGHIGAEADILDRNSIAHPGFILAGTPLQVLSRA